MEIVFYLAGLVAVAATLRVITHTNPVHALLYLIVTLLAISAVFFSLGAYFAGALEIIVYAGAIMVLFVFVVMMLNLVNAVQQQERAWIKPSVWIGTGLMSLVLLVVLIIAIRSLSDQDISGEWRNDEKKIGGASMIPFQHVLILASVLFVLGLRGLLVRRNLLFMLISLEVMINAAALAFIVAGSYWGQADGQVMKILAAAEASIGLALLLQLYRRRHTLNIDSLSEMRG